MDMSIIAYNQRRKLHDNLFSEMQENLSWENCVGAFGFVLKSQA